VGAFTKPSGSGGAPPPPPPPKFKKKNGFPPIPQGPAPGGPIFRRFPPNGEPPTAPALCRRLFPGGGERHKQTTHPVGRPEINTAPPRPPDAFFHIFFVGRPVLRVDPLTGPNPSIVQKGPFAGFPPLKKNTTENALEISFRPPVLCPGANPTAGLSPVPPTPPHRSQRPPPLRELGTFCPKVSRGQRTPSEPKQNCPWPHIGGWLISG